MVTADMCRCAVQCVPGVWLRLTCAAVLSAREAPEEGELVAGSPPLLPSTNLDPDEIPAVPENRFLARDGGRREDREEGRDRGRRGDRDRDRDRRRSTSRSRDRHGSGHGGRERRRSRTQIRAGKKVKGRGFLVSSR